MNRPSPWWYLLPAALAAGCVLVAGFVVGERAGAVVDTVRSTVDETSRIGRSGLSTNLAEDERRIIAGSLPGRPADAIGPTQCQVTPKGGQPAPDVTRIDNGFSVKIGEQRWAPLFDVRATASGPVKVTCRGRAAGTQFALVPWFASDVGRFLGSAAAALGLGGLGLLVALAVGAVIFVLQLRSRTPQQVT